MSRSTATHYKNHTISSPRPEALYIQPVIYGQEEVPGTNSTRFESFCTKISSVVKSTVVIEEFGIQKFGTQIFW